MMKRASLLRLLVAGALACTCAFVPEASAKPASFKVWSGHWQSTLANSFGVGATACSRGSDSQKGKCFVKQTIATYRAIDPLFASGIAKIEAGQAPACRKAISSYSVAFRKTAATVEGYLEAHASTATLSEIKHDFDGKTYTTLDSLVRKTDASAIRICG
jgi:hypothetical protein